MKRLVAQCSLNCPSFPRLDAPLLEMRLVPGLMRGWYWLRRCGWKLPEVREFRRDSRKIKIPLGLSKSLLRESLYQQCVRAYGLRGVHCTGPRELPLAGGGCLARRRLRAQAPSKRRMGKSMDWRMFWSKSPPPPTYFTAGPLCGGGRSPGDQASPHCSEPRFLSFLPAFFCFCLSPHSFLLRALLESLLGNPRLRLCCQEAGLAQFLPRFTHEIRNLDMGVGVPNLERDGMIAGWPRWASVSLADLGTFPSSQGWGGLLIIFMLIIIVCVHVSKPHQSHFIYWLIYNLTQFPPNASRVLDSVA